MDEIVFICGKIKYKINEKLIFEYLNKQIINNKVIDQNEIREEFERKRNEKIKIYQKKLKKNIRKNSRIRKKEKSERMIFYWFWKWWFCYFILLIFT